MQARWGGLCCALLSAHCITVTTVNIGAKTSLENQLMGEFEPLTDEEMLAASVRAGPQQPDLGAGALQAAAIAARQRQVFNQDDIRTLKTQGCLGEGLQAQLVPRDCQGSHELLSLRGRLVQEENADRQSLITWAMRKDVAWVALPRDEVQAVYQRMLVQQAQPQDLIQQDNGTWQRLP